MNFIHTHQRTALFLDEWAQYAQLVIPVFFFWNARNELQKSVTGLLRSMLYQT